MRYLGNKSRLAKYLKPILEKHLTSNNWYIEPFVGAGGMITQIDHNLKFGFDVDPYIIALLQAVRDGWIPPDSITSNEYKNIRDYKEDYPQELVGFVGYGCSYGGKWFAGMARGGVSSSGLLRNHVAESKRNLLALKPLLNLCALMCIDYRDDPIVPGSVVYCDPPYGYDCNTTKYKHQFDHAEFFEWVRQKSLNNYVYVSEYDAPADFKCIWEKESKVGIHHGFEEHPKRVEKLFVYNGGLSDDI